MDINDVQLVGGPCGQHGPYTFYKAFKYTKNGIKQIVTLSEFFFVKMWRDSDLLCIGELQLLWIDKNSEQMLASLRLYFLPENTPEGRMDHGEDEVLAIAEKVVIRVEDLITWITVEAEWSWGRLAKCEAELKPVQENPDRIASARKPTGTSFTLSESTLDFSDVEHERKQLDLSPDENTNPHVIILSFPKYCRYRAMMKRLEGVENLYLKYKIVNALGGFYVIHPNTRVLFCRDTFDYPELEGHELLCNHLAPKLKGRPRGKRKKRSVSPGSESNESESSITNHYTRSTERSNGLRCDSPIATRRSTRCHEHNENKQFLKVLSAFMRAIHLPMGRIPSLGYKELNLHEFFTKVQKLGGYDAVTTNRLWKSIFDDMSGNQNSTSAATVIRRHYERFLLAYERHLKGEEYKPLPVSERRRLKNKRGNNNLVTSSVSDAESSSGDASAPSTSRQTSTPPGSVDNKDSSNQGRTSSLRSVRVKPERQKDKQNTSEMSSVVQSNNINNNTSNSSNEASVKVEPDDTIPLAVKPKIEKLIIKTESMTVKTEFAPVKIEVVPDIINVKTEIKIESPAIEISKVKIEKIEPIKSESPIKIEPLPEKNIEPVTSAVAPVAQKVSVEKTLSPVEGKENIPIIKTGDTAMQNTEPEVIEIPYKSKPPEIIDVESSTYKSISNTFIDDVKKIKLDILKEGGLEVTPVRSTLPSSASKDVRASVIQPTAQIIAKPIMPPPSINSVPPKRIHNLTVPQTINISQVKVPPATPIKQIRPDNFAFANNSTPPKVVQSKSIYTYSEKTVYGNPKDILQPSFKSPAQAPRFVGLRQSGGDPVDLSMTSPQKPVVEIMRIPQSSTSNFQSPYNRDSVAKNLYRTNTTAPSLLDGRRLGSNLEITLVGPKTTPYAPKLQNYHQKLFSHKRPISESYNMKVAKPKMTDENGRYSKYITSPHKSNIEVGIPNPFLKSANTKNDVKSVPQLQKSFPTTVPHTIPSYLSQFHESTNGIPPFMPPLMDSLYYQAAMQNIYSNNLASLPPPILPIPTAEQLKFYAELMAHGRFNFPFQLPQEGLPSLVNNNDKKP